jgi:hypothetical protein
MRFDHEDETLDSRLARNGGKNQRPREDDIVPKKWPGRNVEN